MCRAAIAGQRTEQGIGILEAGTAEIEAGIGADVKAGIGDTARAGIVGVGAGGTGPEDGVLEGEGAAGIGDVAAASVAGGASRSGEARRGAGETIGAADSPAQDLGKCSLEDKALTPAEVKAAYEKAQTDYPGTMAVTRGSMSIRSLESDKKGSSLTKAQAAGLVPIVHDIIDRSAWPASFV